MPTMPIREQLREEIEGRRRDLWRFRLSLLLDDLSDMGPEIDTESEHGSLSSMSSTDSDSTSTSQASSETEDRLYQWLDEQLLKATDEVGTTPGLPPVPRASQWSILDHHRINRPHQFRRILRVSPSTFDSLLKKIQDHPVFHNASNSPQLSPQIQLAIFLNRTGHYGNHSGPESLADWAGVSTGTVENCTVRSMVAILQLHDEVFGPPSSYDMARSSQWVKSAICPGWSGGTLTGDGTTFPLFERPAWHGEAWLDRKSRYSMNAQLINLPHNLKFVDYSVGHTGSVHDSYAFQGTRIYKEHQKFLGPNNWMWADSAYPPSTWTLAPFKKPKHGQLNSDQRRFNYHVSKVRVRSEHAIGLLKGRFQSLKELRFQISTKKAHHFVVLWIVCCLILHNLIIGIEEERAAEDDEGYELEGDEDGEDIEKDRTVEDVEDREGHQDGEGSEDDEDGEGNEDGEGGDGYPGRSDAGKEFRLRMMRVLLDSIGND